MTARRWRWFIAAALIALAPVASFAEDGGEKVPAESTERPLTHEDEEVIRELELLENLDAAAELDLLVELDEP